MLGSGCSREAVRSSRVYYKRNGIPISKQPTKKKVTIVMFKRVNERDEEQQRSRMMVSLSAATKTVGKQYTDVLTIVWSTDQKDNLQVSLMSKPPSYTRYSRQLELASEDMDVIYLPIRKCFNFIDRLYSSFSILFFLLEDQDQKKE